MLFNSFSFLVFFLVVFLVYFLTQPRYRWIVLLVASYYFYMNWDPRYAILMLFSTVFSFVCALLLEGAATQSKKKMYVALGVIVNFSILFVFKYFNFLNDSVYNVLASLHIRWELPDLHFLLPVGISFYTFQAVGYIIDVYRGEIRAERHIGIFALFKAFFPQLVAGPIERAKHLLPQFYEVKRFSEKMAADGLKLMLWGFFMKVVIADRAGLYVDAVYNNPSLHSGTTLFVATILFSIQIYCDFGGYSLIAVGSAKVLGFDLMRNFRRPYFASTITDFWRRWHISLSTWFKDYLYIPLGGNRVSKGRNYFNLFLTFIVSGLWHGANWTFVIWGALHGFFQVFEKAFRLNVAQKGILLRFAQYSFTICLVMFAWIFFRANTVGDSFYIVKSIFLNFTPDFYLDKTTFFYLAIAVPILFAVEIMQEFFSNGLTLGNQFPVLRYAGYVFILLLIVSTGVFDGGQFIYFQF